MDLVAAWATLEEDPAVLWLSRDEMSHDESKGQTRPLQKESVPCTKQWMSGGDKPASQLVWSWTWDPWRHFHGTLMVHEDGNARLCIPNTNWSFSEWYWSLGGRDLGLVSIPQRSRRIRRLTKSIRWQVSGKRWLLHSAAHVQPVMGGSGYVPEANWQPGKMNGERSQCNQKHACNYI